jgi:hypothetical protein
VHEESVTQKNKSKEHATVYPLYKVGQCIIYKLKDRANNTALIYQNFKMKDEIFKYNNCKGIIDCNLLILNIADCTLE